MHSLLFVVYGFFFCLQVAACRVNPLTRGSRPFLSLRRSNVDGFVLFCFIAVSDYTPSYKTSIYTFTSACLLFYFTGGRVPSCRSRPILSPCRSNIDRQRSERRVASHKDVGSTARLSAVSYR